MNPNPFNIKDKLQAGDGLFRDAAWFDPYWENEIQKMMEKGHPYQRAYDIVSRRRIQELFEKDIKITFTG